MHWSTAVNGMSRIPKFIYAFPKMLMDMSNSIVGMLLPVTWYVAITKILKTGPGLPLTLDSLTHIHYYVDNSIMTVQDGKKRQCQVLKGSVWYLKLIFPFLPINAKESVSIKNMLCVCRGGQGGDLFQWIYWVDCRHIGRHINPPGWKVKRILARWGEYRAWMTPKFHQQLLHWWEIVMQS